MIRVDRKPGVRLVTDHPRDNTLTIRVRRVDLDLVLGGALLAGGPGTEVTAAAERIGDARDRAARTNGRVNYG